MKKDRIQEITRRGQEMADALYENTSLEKHEFFINDTLNSLHTITNKTAVVKNKIEKLKKCPKHAKMNPLGTTGIFMATTLATMGAATVLSAETDYQTAALIGGYLTGSALGFVNTACCYSKPITNAYNSFKTYCLDKKLKRLDEQLAFRSAFIERFAELQGKNEDDMIM